MTPIDTLRGAAVRHQSDTGIERLPWAPEPMPSIHLYLVALGIVLIVAGIVGHLI